jgi:DNA-binding FadR family transcriptional regulator
MPGPSRPPSGRRAHEEVLDRIERAIADGELSTGDRLPGERELAESYGVSRPSVREALRVLETLGIIVARRGTGADSGSIVVARGGRGLSSALRLHSSLQQIDTRDFVDLRVVLEAEAAGRAAALAAAPTAHLRELVAALDEIQVAEDYHLADTNFHVELARISGNALLPVLMEALRDVTQRAMVAGLDRLDDWRLVRDRLNVEHQRIVACIEAHDPEAARAAVRDHILGFYRATIGDVPG